MQDKKLYYRPKRCSMQYMEVLGRQLPCYMDNSKLLKVKRDDDQCYIEEDSILGYKYKIQSSMKYNVMVKEEDMYKLCPSFPNPYRLLHNRLRVQTGKGIEDIGESCRSYKEFLYGDISNDNTQEVQNIQCVLDSHIETEIGKAGIRQHCFSLGALSTICDAIIRNDLINMDHYVQCSPFGNMSFLDWLLAWEALPEQTLDLYQVSFKQHDRSDEEWTRMLCDKGKETHNRTTQNESDVSYPVVYDESVSNDCEDNAREPEVVKSCFDWNSILPKPCPDEPDPDKRITVPRNVTDDLQPVLRTHFNMTCTATLKFTLIFRICRPYLKSYVEQIARQIKPNDSVYISKISLADPSDDVPNKVEVDVVIPQLCDSYPLVSNRIPSGASGDLTYDRLRRAEYIVDAVYETIMDYFKHECELGDIL